MTTDAVLTCNINPLQPTGFRLILDRKSYPNVAFFASTVSHPSMDLDPAFQHVPRLTLGIPQAGESLTFGQLSVTMMVDEDMMAYGEIYDWMVRLVNENRRGPAMGETPSESDIILEILTSNNNINRSIRYLNCIPTSLGQIPLTAVGGDIEPIYIDVTFAFSHFELGDKQ